MVSTGAAASYGLKHESLALIADHWVNHAVRDCRHRVLALVVSAQWEACEYGAEMPGDWRRYLVRELSFVDASLCFRVDRTAKEYTQYTNPGDRCFFFQL